MKDKEYELVPEDELEKLRAEVKELKEFEITPTKKMEVSILELNRKLDKLLDVFERASRDLRKEEGGLTFTDKMKPISEKLNKILEQNAELASGILALADMIKPERKLPQMPGQLPRQPHAPPRIPPQGRIEHKEGFPQPPSGVHIRTPIPPSQGLPQKAPLPPPSNLPPPKKRTFGL